MDKEQLKNILFMAGSQWDETLTLKQIDNVADALEVAGLIPNKHLVVPQEGYVDDFYRPQHTDEEDAEIALIAEALKKASGAEKRYYIRKMLGPDRGTIEGTQRGDTISYNRPSQNPLPPLEKIPVVRENGDVDFIPIVRDESSKTSEEK